MRPLRDVGIGVWVAVIVALATQCAWSTRARQLEALPDALPPAPNLGSLDAVAFGDPAAVSYLISLRLQSADDGSASSSRFVDVHYGHLSDWLSRALDLDPTGHYPLLLASHVYSQVQDPVRQRKMIDLVRVQAKRDLARRWQWLAHVSIMARHRLRDPRLALSLASDLAHAPPSISMPGWARQMAVFLHEDLGEYDAARALLGGLLDSGTVQDVREADFLARRLAALGDAKKSSKASATRLDTAAPRVRFKASP